MASDVKPIPDNYHSITPYLIVADAAAAIAFYQRIFGATQRMCLASGGKVAHAELEIGDSVVMLADEAPEMGARGPQSLGGSPVGVLLYVERVDEVFERAVAAGAEALRPVTDQFYGDRSGTLRDPFGHQWTIATHVEDLSPAELDARFEAMHSAADA